MTMSETKTTEEPSPIAEKVLAEEDVGFIQGIANRVKPVNILSVPLERRLQMFAQVLWVWLSFYCYIIFYLMASYVQLWPICIAYMIFMMVDDAPNNGGRYSEWFRSMRVWKWFAEYYNTKIVKEANLTPNKSYLFAYYPHGILTFGMGAAFGSDGAGFSKTFPGIRPHLLTLDSNFRTPIYRDLLLWMGVASVNKRSCLNILKKGNGNSIFIVPGGATESLNAIPGTASIVLKRRLGFIKVAMQAGVDLVPVYGFGENDLYNQNQYQPGSRMYSFQKWFQKTMTFTLPICYGRGIFTYNVGLYPFRRNITAVVGKPIPVKQNSNPTTEEILEIQEKYKEELFRIWHKYKDDFAPDRISDLTIVE